MEQIKERILVVDDEVENLRAIERTLRSRFEVTGCESPQTALDKIKSEDFAVVISDQRMPGMIGTEFLAKVAHERPLVTRIILTAYTETKELLDAINRAEIYRYITKPWDNDELLLSVQQAVDHFHLRTKNLTLIQELEEKNRRLEDKERELTALNRSLETLVEQRTSELRQANERLNELAMTDPLTKVMNRRAFFLKFNEELERSKRYRHPITVAMIDVDHFKPFNDMEGHLCGDEALRKIAALFTSNLRKTDALCRYGGEEFLVMMPETKLEAGSDICERLRRSVEDNQFQGQFTSAYLTVSIGIAGYPKHGEVALDLVKAADQALYQAKEYGRNRIVRA